MSKKHFIRTQAPCARPTFVGIGAQKCATSWLATCLRQHPQIFMPYPKEIRYFSQHLDKGDAWYMKHFSRGGGRYKASGEFTASYLMSASAARIRESLGDVQIIVSLRNPIERFFSQYRVEIRRGVLGKREFRMLDLKAAQAAISTCPDLLQQGMYASRLQEYMDAFGAENVHVIVKDDIDVDPLPVIRNLYRFLHVDDDFVPPAARAKIHGSFLHKHQLLQTMRLQVARIARKHAPRIINTSFHALLSRLYRRINQDKHDIAVGDGVREFLQDCYSAEIARLEGLLSRPLPQWHGGSPNPGLAPSRL